MDDSALDGVTNANPARRTDYLVPDAAGCAARQPGHLHPQSRATESLKGNEAAAGIMVTAARGLNRELRSRRKMDVPDLQAVPTPRLPERLQPRVDMRDFARLLDALDRRAAYPGYPRVALARERALVQSTDRAMRVQRSRRSHPCLSQFLMETGLRASECSRLNDQVSRSRDSPPAPAWMPAWRARPTPGAEESSQQTAPGRWPGCELKRSEIGGGLARGKRLAPPQPRLNLYVR